MPPPSERDIDGLAAEMDRQAADVARLDSEITRLVAAVHAEAESLRRRMQTEGPAKVDTHRLTTLVTQLSTTRALVVTKMNELRRLSAAVDAANQGSDGEMTAKG